MKTIVVSVLFSIFCAFYSQAQHPYLSVLEDRSIRFDTSYWVNVSNLVNFDTAHAWTDWQLAENFTFGKDRGSLQMITDLSALHPYFRDKIYQLISNCKNKGIEIRVVESFRTQAKQAEYFGMGKKYTRSKGGKSKHQYGLACDVVPIVEGVAQWEDKLLWKKVGTEGEKLGLRWGGRWRNPYDPAHFEWTGGMTTVHLAAGYFPKPAKEVYPCIEEDIRQLRKFWNAWENEQAMTSRAVRTKRLAATVINP